MKSAKRVIPLRFMEMVADVYDTGQALPKHENGIGYSLRHLEHLLLCPALDLTPGVQRAWPLALGSPCADGGALTGPRAPWRADHRVRAEWRPGGTTQPSSVALPSVQIGGSEMEGRWARASLAPEEQVLRFLWEAVSKIPNASIRFPCKNVFFC